MRKPSLPDNAVNAARPGLNGQPGTGNGVRTALPYGSGPAAFKDAPPAPFGQAVGANPNKGQPFSLRFIPPLALFNDAAQWVNTKFFNRPMPLGQSPDSNPPLRAQYFTPPPIAANRLAAGIANVQQQLGNLSIQATRLSQSDSNFYGG